MLINDLPIIMVKCLICTIIIEYLVSIILKIKDKKDLLNIVLVNIMTNPLVTSIPVYFNIKYGLIQRHIVLIILEIFTIISEGFVYKKYLNYKKINPYILSIILNASSYLLGEVINSL